MQIVLLDVDRREATVLEVERAPEFRHRHEGHFYDLCDVLTSDVVNEDGEVVHPAGTRRYAWSGKA